MDLKGNLSTEHQRPGDAKRPADTQDRGQAPAGGDPRDNMGENTDQDGASAADRADNMGANTTEEDQVHDAVKNHGGAVDAH